ncbi:Uncharacterised protein [Kluyvera cryocrescens]|uniref:Uncharacterized protein n=1 Tax=Kluyvera cryocrescens TaxID=580 RepID=A0A485D1I5_KLUCR|nr:Uncharacterised protein [Kluyvera cryocrescens]
MPNVHVLQQFITARAANAQIVLIRAIGEATAQRQGFLNGQAGLPRVAIGFFPLRRG